MKIIIAPDSFKGTMTSIEVCDIIENNIKKHIPHAEIIKIPVADGGEGTVDAYLSCMGGKRINLSVTGPNFQKIDAFYGILPDHKTAVIEMAAASGLPLSTEKNPMNTTTYGTGELIAHAVQSGCKKIILGIGGSATNDGGIGALAALGVRFLNEQGGEVIPTGAGIADIRTIDDTGLLVHDVEFLVACDVSNPLAGESGASAVFGPQKGATQEQVKILDANLLHLNALLKEKTGIDRKDIPGMGAAGGMALCLDAFLNVEMQPGIDIVLSTVAFEQKLENCSMVITGEGKIDGQSLKGKVPVGVAWRAREKQVPVVALVGDVGEGYEALYDQGLTAIFSTNARAVPFEQAKSTCKQDLAFLVDSLMRFKKI